MYEIALAFSVFCLVGVSFAFIRSAAFSIFHPLTFYTLFHGFIFVFRPIVARIMDFQTIYRSYQFTPSASDKLTVILASNLGFVTFAACCMLAGNVAMRFKQDSVAIAQRERVKPLFLWVAAICVPIGAYSLSIVWNGAATSEVGYAGMVRDAGTGVSVNTANNGYLMEAQLMLASCGAVLAWVFRFRVLAVLPLVLFVVFRAGTGGRGPFVTALATVGLLWLYERRRRLPTVPILAIMAAVVVVFNVVGDDRGASVRRAIGQENSSEVFGRNRIGERWLEGMDFGNLEYFEYLVYTIPQKTHTYGYFLDTLQVFTEPVPRVLWSGKPVGAPFNNIYLLDYGNAIGMTRSLPGQGWYSLGWLGVIFWCGLWGYVLGRIYRRFVEGAQGTFETAAYMVFLPILIVAFRDGQLVTVFRQGLFFFAPIVMWWLFARALGVPGVAAVRQMLAQRRRKNGDIALASGGEQTTRAPAGDAGLPPAVLRRRLALGRDTA